MFNYTIADYFFVFNIFILLKMKQAALGRTRALGVELQTFSGRYDGDTTQIEAIERLTASGARGILIAPENLSRTTSDSIQPP